MVEVVSIYHEVYSRQNIHGVADMKFLVCFRNGHLILRMIEVGSYWDVHKLV